MALRTVIMALWLTIAAVTSAQEAQVQRFFLDPTDLEGQVHERLDGNGDRCALIKVQSAIPCEFNGDIVGDVVKSKGSYLVYVCAKDNFTRAIDIIPEGYLPTRVNFADFGINEIKGGQTYILRIEPPLPDTTDRQMATLTINPATSGCFILIDGHLVGVEKWSGRVSASYHKIECMKDGFLNEKYTISLSPNEKRTLNMPPLSPYGYLIASSTPKASGIWIDDERFDNSNNGYQKYKIGKHKIKIMAHGYNTYTDSIEIFPTAITYICWDFTTNSKGDTQPIFTSIQESPAFPGGDSELSRWMNKNIHYPAKCQESSITGTIPVNFRVNKRGEIDSIKVEETNDMDADLRDEAVRVIKSLPGFIPGRNNGIPVNVWYRININFGLK